MAGKERIELTPPLPDDAQGGAVSFFAVRGGVLPGWRAAPRSEATHARIELRGPDGQTHKREVAKEEAEAFLAEVERLHSGPGEGAIPASAGQIAPGAINLSCPRCGIPRRYEGRRSPMPLADGVDKGNEDAFQSPATESGTYEEYACPRCGSVELFRAGPLQHPLPGAS